MMQNLLVLSTALLVLSNLQFVVVPLIAARKGLGAPLWFLLTGVWTTGTIVAGLEAAGVSWTLVASLGSAALPPSTAWTLLFAAAWSYAPLACVLLSSSRIDLAPVNRARRRSPRARRRR